MSERKTKLLNVFRFWLFGTFVIVWAALTMYIGLFTSKDWMVAIQAGLPIWGTVAVLCVVWYFVYQTWLKRQPD